MYNDQLDFKSQFPDYYKDEENEDYIVEKYINNESYQNRILPEMSEQLDYMIQNNVNLYPSMNNKPKTLVYSKINKKISNKKEKKKLYFNSYGREYGKSSGYLNLKNKQVKKNDNTKININKNIQVTNSLNNKGLFDPNLKKNELDCQRRSVKEREERIEKIKNYDIKFGSRIKTLRMYNNYVDLVDDLVNEKSEKEFKKKVFSNKNDKVELNISKPILQNNLDFDFSEQEQIIKSLEEEIAKERRYRTDINMKYLQKVKELEMVKVKNLTGSSKPLSKKSSKLMRTYSNDKFKCNKNNSEFKNALNKTIDIVKKNFPKDKRPNSHEIINQQVKNFTPAIKQIVDKSFGNLYKEIIKNNKDLITKSGRSQGKKSGRIHNKNEISGNDILEQQSPNIDISNNNYISNPVNYNSNFLTSPINNSRFILLNSSNIEKKMIDDVLNQKNLEKFNSLDKLNMISTLNKEIDNYNKGLPQLINKVDSVLGKINNSKYLDDRIHPLIQLASKHTGHMVHLHMDEIVEEILDDFLIELVHELQYIEEENEKRENKKQFVSYVSNYYKDFEMIRNIELDVSKKLSSKNYNIVPIKEEKPDRKDIIIYKNPFDIDILQSTKHSINPNILLSNELYNEYSGKYKTKINNSIILNCEKYKKNFYEYMKTIGAFYFPNIFLLYDEVVSELTNDILDQETNYVIRQIDNLAADLFKDEIL